MYVIAIILALVYFYYNPPTQDDKPLYSTFSIIFGITLDCIVFAGILFLIRYSYTVRFTNSIYLNQSLIGQRQIELKEEILELNSRNITTEFKLASIKKISRYKGYFFLYIDKDIAIIIPKETNGAEELINALSSKINKRVC